jgi:hypothetical protein
MYKVHKHVSFEGTEKVGWNDHDNPDACVPYIKDTAARQDKLNVGT